jgi:hypothetical protein
LVPSAWAPHRTGQRNSASLSSCRAALAVIRDIPTGLLNVDVIALVNNASAGIILAKLRCELAH